MNGFILRKYAGGVNNPKPGKPTNILSSGTLFGRKTIRWTFGRESMVGVS